MAPVRGFSIARGRPPSTRRTSRRPPRPTPFSRSGSSPPRRPTRPMRPTRAVAYAESALAALGERRDRHGLRGARGPARAVPRRGRRCRGATAALRQAADVVPAEPSMERARILALLAQERMIAGAFRDAERAAGEALEVARGLGEDAEPEAIHAMTTLAVVRAGATTRRRRCRCSARRSSGRASSGSSRSGGGPSRTRRSSSSCWAARARRSTRRSRDMGEARALDLDAVYGNLLGGNVAGILVDVGRWPEARELSLRALDWSPAGDPVRQRDPQPRDRRDRVRGRRGGGPAPGPDPGGARDGRRLPVRDPGLPGDGVVRDVERRPRRRPAGGGARLGAGPGHRGLGADGPHGVDGAGGRGGDRRRGPRAAPDRRRGRVAGARRADPRGGGGRGRAGPGRGRRRRDAGEPEASLATARAFHARLQGRDDPAALGRPRGALARHRRPVSRGAGPVAPGRGDPRRRHAGPGGRGRTDARVVRADAREPLGAAVGSRCGCTRRPLLRRAPPARRPGHDPLSPEVDAVLDQPAPAPAGPAARRSRRDRSGRDRARPAPLVARPPSSGDTFGLSKRELEVLGADRPGPDEPRDRRPAVHQPEDRWRPRRQHPVQARRVGSRGGGRGRHPARARGRRRRRSRRSATSGTSGRPRHGPGIGTIDAIPP